MPLRRGLSLGAFRSHLSDLLEGAAVSVERRPLAGVGLPALDDRVAIGGVVFEEAGRPPAGLGGNQRRAGAAEEIEDSLAAPGAVADRIGDQRHRLDRRVHGKLFLRLAPRLLIPA